METPMPTAPLAEPTPAPMLLDREHTVDVIRGFALLGILVMNIIAFAYPSNSYENPTTPGSEPFIGSFSGLNAAVWWFAHLAADQKMMALFSMLFGGGVVLLMRNRPEGFAGLYYRRLAFLGAVGFVHGFGIWFGDILLSYSIAGLLLYPVRNLSARVLMALGTGVLVFGMLVALGMGSLMKMIPPEQQAQMAPTPEKYAEAVDVVRSGLVGTLKYNRSVALQAQVFGLVLWTFWRALGLMLIGMGLMKLGFFTGRWSARAYVTTALFGYVAGLALIVPTTLASLRAGHGDMVMFSLEGQGNYVGAVGVALAHASVLILVVRAGLLRSLTDRLAAVGRMAFTNYLATSLMMTFCFYGWGLGLFAKYERAQMYLFVLAAWSLILMWSPLWLSRFRTGPLEWLWRSATHLRWQPLIK